MFIRRRHLLAIEETLYKLQHRCADLETEIRQLKCQHKYTKFEPAPRQTSYDGTITYAKGIAYKEVCTGCGKDLGLRTIEEKARREYEAAKAAYNAVKESE